jgi:hypothetical protein
MVSQVSLCFRVLSFLTLSAAACGGLPVEPPHHGPGAQGKGDGIAPGTKWLEASVVLTTMDPQTDDWARGTVSMYDGLPINPPEGRDVHRLREIYVRLHQRFLKMPLQPTAIGYMYNFGAAQNPATEGLAAMLATPDLPIVLAPMPENGAKEIYLTSADHRFTGHSLMAKATLGPFDVYAMPVFDGEGHIALPIALFAAHLQTILGLGGQSALAAAETQAESIRRWDDQHQEHVVASLTDTLNRLSIGRVSASTLLEMESTELEQRVGGKIVLIGDDNPPAWAVANIAEQLETKRYGSEL